MTNTPSSSGSSETARTHNADVAGPSSSTLGSPRPASGKTNVFAIISLVTAFFASLLAIIAGHVALHQIKRSGEAGRGFAVVGLVLGYVGFAVGTVALVAFLTVTLGAGSYLLADGNNDSAESAPTEPEVSQESQAPDAALSEFRSWSGTIALNDTELQVTLDGENAPVAVASFLSLAGGTYFEGTTCHRLTTAGIFVLQCGDPTGTGTGGPGYSFGPVENDPADGFYPAGTLAMARVGNDGYSNGSQFFIVYQDSSISADSAGGYTVFGTITGGLDAVQEIAAAGVQGGASDGPPALTALLGTMSFQ
ncbi:MAG: peptidylprolyl isomerase [Microbacteriaceae bacterium]